VFAAVTTKVSYLDLIFQHCIPDRNILMLFFLLMYLKIKLVVLPYLILLAYVYPLGELETSLPSWLTISRSAHQPDVFLLLMLFARKLRLLTRTKLRLLISLNFAYSYTEVLVFVDVVVVVFIIVFFHIFLIHILCVIFVVLCL
jgi:hypothetical protein